MNFMPRILSLRNTDDEFLQQFRVPREILHNLGDEFRQIDFYPSKDIDLQRS